jgi:hypothetical protein
MRSACSRIGGERTVSFPYQVWLRLPLPVRAEGLDGGSASALRSWFGAGEHVGPCVMTDFPKYLDEAELQRRIEQQQLLVARLISESRSSVEANDALYRLCEHLAQLRYQKKMRASGPVTPTMSR